MKEVRRKARAHFRSGASSGSPFANDRPGLEARAMVVDEASSHRPKRGLEILDRLLSRETEGSPEARLLRSAGLAGTAACVFEAASAAARERGFFASSLMGFRAVQESLAGLYAGTEALRLGACRVCSLLERGERERGEAESLPLHAKALALAREARALALEMLGEAWVSENLPGDGSPDAEERIER